MNTIKKTMCLTLCVILIFNMLCSCSSTSLSHLQIKHNKDIFNINATTLLDISNAFNGAYVYNEEFNGYFFGDSDLNVYIYGGYSGNCPIWDGKSKMPSYDYISGMSYTVYSKNTGTFCDVHTGDPKDIILKKLESFKEYITFENRSDEHKELESFLHLSFDLYGNPVTSNTYDSNYVFPDIQYSYRMIDNILININITYNLPYSYEDYVSEPLNMALQK